MEKSGQPTDREEWIHTIVEALRTPQGSSPLRENLVLLAALTGAETAAVAVLVDDQTAVLEAGTTPEIEGRLLGTGPITIDREGAIIREAPPRLREVFPEAAAYLSRRMGCGEMEALLLCTFTEAATPRVETALLEAALTTTATAVCKTLGDKQLTLWRARFETLFESTPEAILYIDEERGRAYVNEAARRMLGIEGENLEIDPELLAGKMADLRKELRNREAVEAELEAFLTGRSERTHRSNWVFPEGAYAVSLLPLRGEQRGKLWIFEDVTELYFTREELALYTEDLKAANREKNNIINIVSHDLKNPLGNIILLTELLDNAVTEEEDKESLRLLRAAGRQSLELVNNLLEVGRLEQGERLPDPEKTSLLDLVRAATEQVESRARRKGTKIETEVHDGLKEEVETYPVYVIRILGNLLSNAVKFSPPASTVRVSLEHGAEGPQVAITDQGPGLSPEDREGLFNKFATLSAKPTGEEQSSGLGLYIVKSLAKKIGATVFADNAPEGGAVFTLRLPR